MHQRLRIVQNGNRREWPKSEPLRHGAEGNEQTLRYAAAMVREDSSQDDRVRSLAEQLVSACAPHDSACEVSQLFEFVRDRIRYVEDPADTERIADAWRTVERQSGDCGDKSILLATLLGSIGYKSRFIVQSWSGDLSQGYDHVHLEAFMPDGSTLELDPTNEHGFVGWEHADVARASFPIWLDTVAAGMPRPAGMHLSGIFDQLAPQLIQTGVQVGSQYAQSALQQHRASASQEKEIEAAWNDLIAQAVTLFQSISAKANAGTITAADFQNALDAYGAIQNFLSQYGTQRIQQQWNDPSYKAAFEHDLQLYQSALAARPAGSQGTVASGNQPTTIGNLFSNPLVPIAIVIAAVVLMKR